MLEDSAIQLFKKIPMVKRDGIDLKRVVKNTTEEIRESKADLINNIGQAESIRDFGGVFLVHGKYLLEPALKLGCRYACMVDYNSPDALVSKVEEALEKNPELKYEFVGGDFRDSDLYKKIHPTDVSILYDVLLHQENYVEIIKQVALKTKKFICFAQPCLKESFFALPSGAVCLQFYDPTVKAFLKEGSTIWPDEPAVDKFMTRYWMWGHTISHIISVLYGLGWNLDYGEVIDNRGGIYWEYPLLRFKPKV